MKTMLLLLLLLLPHGALALSPAEAFEQAQALERAGKPAADFVPLLKRAAQGGEVDAQLKLGRIYRFGRKGIAKNFSEAKRWYDMAAARGSQEAMTQLQMIYVKSGHEHFNSLQADENVRFLAVQARQGDAGAALKLGMLAERGAGGAPDFARAAELYAFAANAGLPQAQTRLGLLYEDGKGVPQSDDEAVKWLTKAAEQGYADAGRKLAEFYAYNKGMPSEAYAWLVLSLSALFPNVSNLVEVSPDLERLLNTMTPQQVEEGQKLAAHYAEIIRANKKTQNRKKIP